MPPRCHAPPLTTTPTAPPLHTSGPNDPPLQGLTYQTLCAGEIEALLCRARGVVMVQLWAGWGPPAGAQPVHNCLVLHSLGRALQSQELSIFMSSAPGVGIWGWWAVAA